MESIVQWADFNTKPSSLMNLIHDEDCSRMHILWSLSLLMKLNKFFSQQVELICCSSVVKVPDNQKPICFDDAANHGGSEMKLINGGVREQKRRLYQCQDRRWMKLNVDNNERYRSVCKVRLLYTSERKSINTVVDLSRKPRGERGLDFASLGFLNDSIFCQLERQSRCDFLKPGERI